MSGSPCAQVTNVVKKKKEGLNKLCGCRLGSRGDSSQSALVKSGFASEFSDSSLAWIYKLELRT